MKLKIGTVEKEKKEDKNNNDYFNELSDEELEAIESEVSESVEDEVQKITSEEEKELEEGVNGMYIFEEVGINTKYVNRFMELYPKKKIVYHNLITKQFLEWYIKKAPTLYITKDLEIVDSEFVNQSQVEELLKMVDKRLQEPEIEELEKTFEETPEIKETKKTFDSNYNLLINDYDKQMYEFILAEKWKSRRKGVVELDELIEEQMRVNKTNLSNSLRNLLKTFKLDDKFFKTDFDDFSKKTLMERELIIGQADLGITKPKEKIKGREIGKAIKYFHHIEFLYNLMSKKMQFYQPPTQKDTKQITIIKNLLFSHLEDDEIPDKVKKKGKEQSTELVMDKFFEEE